MGFRIIPKSVTLDDLERRNGFYFALFLSNCAAFEANYVKVVEDRPILFVVQRVYSFQQYLQRLPNKFIRDRHSLSKAIT